MAIDPIIADGATPSPADPSPQAGAWSVASPSDPSAIAADGNAPTGAAPSPVAPVGSVPSAAAPAPVAPNGTITPGTVGSIIGGVTGTSGSLVLSGITNPTSLNDTYVPIDGDWNGRPFYVVEGGTAYNPSNNPDEVTIIYWDGDFWNIWNPALPALFTSASDVQTPDLAEDWSADDAETGSPSFAAVGSTLTVAGITPAASAISPSAPAAITPAASVISPSAPAAVIAAGNNPTASNPSPIIP